jgi:hypothetical protein
MRQPVPPAKRAPSDPSIVRVMFDYLSNPKPVERPDRSAPSKPTTTN